MIRRSRAPLAPALLAVVLSAAPARGGPEPTGGEADGRPELDRPMAVLPFDALGIDPERVARLESLFREELGRLAEREMRGRRAIDAALGETALARCSGETSCLAKIGDKLGVELVIAGNVAALGSSHVIHMKLIDAKANEELVRITSDPLRGRPDELILAVRAAAYRLLAPTEIVGSIAVLADVEGAQVEVDGTPVGTTPLGAPAGGLSPGEHEVTVRKPGYAPFSERIDVRFQKTTRVEARLTPTGTAPAGADLTATAPADPPAEPRPWYSSPWAYAGIGVAAAIVGGAIGYALAGPSEIDCTAEPGACTR